MKIIYNFVKKTMITTEKIQKEIDELFERHRLRNFKKNRAFKRDKDKVLFLTACKMYVETKPSEEYIKNEAKRLMFKLAIIENSFSEWKKYNASKYENPLTAWERLNEKDKIKNQLKALNYILNG